MTMKKSFNLGHFSGIALRIHWTFSLLVLGVFGLYLLSGSTIQESLFGVALIVALFVCVVLHEFGHALVARRFNVPTRDITLYPIGGIARLQQIPRKPRKEFLIAIAGPAVNLVIAGLLLVGLMLGGRAVTADVLMEPHKHFLGKLMWLNVIIVGFNLLPAFPMDGGRVLRAVLASKMDYLRSTQIAARIGQGMAFLFGLIGLIVFNPILLFIALFVYVGAQQEAHMTMTRLVTEGVPVRQAMITSFETLHPGSTLKEAVDKLLAVSEPGFPVIDGENVVGMLTRKKLLEAVGAHGVDAKVEQFMEKDFPMIGEDSMLDRAFRTMQEQKLSFTPVQRDGKLVGLLTLENIGEWLMIAGALRGSTVRSESNAVPTLSQ